jgi:hypothetical protein
MRTISAVQLDQSLPSSIKSQGQHIPRRRIRGSRRNRLLPLHLNQRPHHPVPPSRLGDPAHELALLINKRPVHDVQTGAEAITADDFLRRESDCPTVQLIQRLERPVEVPTVFLHRLVDAFDAEVWLYSVRFDHVGEEGRADVVQLDALLRIAAGEEVVDCVLDVSTMAVELAAHIVDRNMRESPLYGDDGPLESGCDVDTARGKCWGRFCRFVLATVEQYMRKDNVRDVCSRPRYFDVCPRSPQLRDDVVVDEIKVPIWGTNASHDVADFRYPSFSGY